MKDEERDSILLSKALDFPQCLLTIFGPIVFCLVGCYLVVLFLERPQYIKFDIEPPNDGYWDYTEKSSIKSGDSKYFVWQEGGYVQCCTNPQYDTREEIVDYFETQLVHDGWIVSQNEYEDCDMVHEMKFWDKEKGKYLVYVRSDGDPNDAQPRVVCLAAWKDEELGHFQILLVSINPSWLTRTGGLFD